MWSIILLVLLSAAIGRLRGWGATDNIANPPKWRKLVDAWGSKYHAAAYMGLVFGLAAWSASLSVIVAAGYALWAAKGWGDYWDYSDQPNDEVGIIDVAVRWVLPMGPWADFVSMSLRGLLGYPLFIGLAAWHYFIHADMQACLLALVIGLGMGLQGVVYHLFRYRLGKVISVPWAHIITEWVMGGLIGLLIVCSI
tara:strand:+ start:890 stop:1477 length:588 start_codon:yes stop_codon:yes gene_type:complete